jgi:ABC-type sugar transport system ATPase subunit
MVQSLDFDNISKLFGVIKALQNVSFSARAGEVCALVGENGAGKSTLLKIMSGDIQPDNGSLLIDGKEIFLKSPGEAIGNGISVIYQERQVVPHLTVAENIFMKDIPVRKDKLIDFKQLYSKTQEIIDVFGLPIKPTDRIARISNAYQQMVEIMKAYRRNSEIIAFDEPTASLTDAEIKTLFEVIKKLKIQNKIIIYVSHRLKEIFEISEAVVVLKDGKYITKVDTKKTNQSELVNYMVGRDLGDIFHSLKRNKNIGEVVLEVKGITTDKINDVCFKLHKGEVLGFSGLIGAGRTETMKAIFGSDPIQSGQIWIEGREVCIKSPQAAIAEGLGLCPEDRISEGIFNTRNVKENISVTILKKLVKYGFIDFNSEKKIAQKAVENLSIKTPSLETNIMELSGGNKQKTLLARWLVSYLKILILDEPTKGIDVGAKVDIYQLIYNLADMGLGVIFISSELPEIIGLSDNIIVMKDGSITGHLRREEANEEKILTFAMLK